MKVFKYQAIGNDYLIIWEPSFVPNCEGIARICDRHFGIGSDGLLVGRRDGSRFVLKIYNPDGSLAEKSGNGVRIFAQFLWDHHTSANEVEILTDSGACIGTKLHDKICVNMGKPKFEAFNLPIPWQQTIVIDGRFFEIFAVSMGNPHCVIFCEDDSESFAKHWGPKIEQLSIYPEKTNVQFVKIIHRELFAVKIWERGAGYTLGSGSSACAVFAAANKLGICGNALTVAMPGGELSMEFNEFGEILQYGRAKKIATCEYEF